MIKKTVCFLVVLSFITSCSVENGLDTKEEHSDNIFQYGTKQSFLDKKYVGELSYAELSKMGNFGLGTFNFADGEMAGLDGHFMRIPVEGENKPADNSDKTPFAVVKFFNADQQSVSDIEMNMTDLQKYITESLSDTGRPVAIKVRGLFNFVKTRSIHKQTEPFQSLDELVENQVTFEFENIEGTIIGYWFPKFMDGVNFPGYHFHFLSKDLKSGGHLLECVTDNIVAELDYPDKLIIQ
jgi:acetolactate decarboxylase